MHKRKYIINNSGFYSVSIRLGILTKCETNLALSFLQINLDCSFSIFRITICLDAFRTSYEPSLNSVFLTFNFKAIHHLLLLISMVNHNLSTLTSYSKFRVSHLSSSLTVSTNGILVFKAMIGLILKF